MAQSPPQAAVVVSHAADDGTDGHHGAVRAVLVFIAGRLSQWVHTLSMTIAGWADLLSDVHTALANDGSSADSSSS